MARSRSTTPKDSSAQLGCEVSRGLAGEANIRKFHIFRTKGERQVARRTEHYNLAPCFIPSTGTDANPGRLRNLGEMLRCTRLTPFSDPPDPIFRPAR